MLAMAMVYAGGNCDFLVQDQVSSPFFSSCIPLSSDSRISDGLSILIAFLVGLLVGLAVFSVLVALFLPATNGIPVGV